MLLVWTTGLIGVIEVACVFLLRVIWVVQVRQWPTAPFARNGFSLALILQSLVRKNKSLLSGLATFDKRVEKQVGSPGGR